MITYDQDFDVNPKKSGPIKKARNPLVYVGVAYLVVSLFNACAIYSNFSMMVNSASSSINVMAAQSAYSNIASFAIYVLCAILSVLLMLGKNRAVLYLEAINWLVLTYYLFLFAKINIVLSKPSTLKIPVFIQEAAYAPIIAAIVFWGGLLILNRLVRRISEDTY